MPWASMANNRKTNATGQDHLTRTVWSWNRGLRPRVPCIPLSSFLPVGYRPSPLGRSCYHRMMGHSNNTSHHTHQGKPPRALLVTAARRAAASIRRSLRGSDSLLLATRHGTGRTHEPRIKVQEGIGKKRRNKKKKVKRKQV